MYLQNLYNNVTCTCTFLTCMVLWLPMAMNFYEFFKLLQNRAKVPVL